jgi:hypothetical protein
MRGKSFILSGITGYIDQYDFIQWHTIGAHLKSLANCPLKRAATNAKLKRYTEERPK